MPSVTAGVVTIGEDHMTEAAVSPAAGAIPQLITDLTPEWLEVGPPVHAILPPEPEPVPEGVPDIYTDVGAIDFGAVEVSA